MIQHCKGLSVNQRCYLGSLINEIIFKYFLIIKFGLSLKGRDIMISLDKENLIKLRKDMDLFEHKTFTEEEQQACRAKVKSNVPLEEPFYLSHDKKVIIKTSENNLTREEKREFLALTQIKLLRSIRFCLILLIAIGVLALLLWLIILF